MTLVLILLWFQLIPGRFFCLRLLQKLSLK